MRLEAFRIKNYRSIIDTGWINVSPDNITTLIGQNESGKTSILEALFSFYNGRIHEDILRSDMKLPEVACSFRVEKEFFEKNLHQERIPSQILNLYKQKPIIYLNRKWKSLYHSDLFYGNDEIMQVIEETIIKEKENEDLLLLKISKLLTDTSRLTEIADLTEKEAKKLLNEINSLNNQLSRLNKNLQKANSESKRTEIQNEVDVLSRKFKTLNNAKELAEKNSSSHTNKLNQLIIKSGYAEKFLKEREKLKNSTELLENVSKDIENLKFELQINPSRRRYNKLLKYLKNLNDKKAQIKIALFREQEMYRFSKECIQIAFSNALPEEIEVKARDSFEKKEDLMDMEELALQIFPHIPEFTLFEDFSSLLPNRIDLEDMIYQNNSTEGFNAVKNFLIVSGLEASFFNELNSRILKQKIENLNGELTLHFQDYWSQNLGRNNKIKINFELEHYDLSNSAKKGKPYLEFWIKDDKERLYPKQRSRGVRWFLSFFLELKATALEGKERKKILLIDEPGLSLHARAQEDVLKVFEDLKNNLQIVYSTHSPHLVNTDKLHRLLAVQRADEFNDHSETLVFDPHKLSLASGDTLSPIYTLMGTRLSESNFIQERNNIVLEDTHTFYYLKTLFEVFSPEEKIYFLPSNGINGIPLLVNMMLGWKLHYIVLLSDQKESREIYNQIKMQLFRGDDSLSSQKLIITKGIAGMEDLFSTIDFKKYVLNKRVGITETNLEYISDNKLSKIDLATSFALRCQSMQLKPQDFDEESRDNISRLISLVHKMIVK